ncbi:AMP-binding enzyme domain-containing protein [Cladophialophora immunda]|nr:AMP-binding enzyme domain-containing protein [Cladophialophora immunda]
MFLAATAAATGGAAIAAYVDAKLNITKDLQSILIQKTVERKWKRAVTKKKKSLWYLFEFEARLHPVKECIWSEAGSYTWAEVHQQSCRYANWFLSQGIASGQLVALYLQNCPEFIFAWLGLWAIGCAPAMINYNLSGDALLHCLRLAEAPLILVDSEFPKRVLEHREILECELGSKIVTLDQEVKDEISREVTDRPGDKYRDNVNGTDANSLIFTSGTTGRPKACPHPVLKGFVSGSVAGRNIGLTTDTRLYNCMPLYHATGGQISMMCMMGGLSLCLGKKFSASGFWNDVRKSQATCITYVGETARYLLAMPPSPLDKQHRVQCMIGNGLRPDVWVKFRERFGVQDVAEFFSSSEGVFGLLNHCKGIDPRTKSSRSCNPRTNSFSNTGDYLLGAVGHHGALLRFMFRNVYVPVEINPASNELLRDPRTGFAKRRSYDEGGEIIVAVSSVAAFAGYYKNPEATAKKFERDVFRTGDLWYRTGDALRRTTDGRWYFLDRLGDTFRWKSENVSTAEVAGVLEKFPGIAEACVYGVEVPGHEGRAGCAALLIDHTGQASFDFEAWLFELNTTLRFFFVLRALKPSSPRGHFSASNFYCRIRR